MLRLLRLVEQFSELERGLVDEWAELRFQLTVADESRAERAAALLAPANPGRLAKVIRLAVERRGPGIGPEALRRLLKRLDDEGIAGRLELQGVQKAPPKELRTKQTLRAQWELRLAAVPPDWSDIYAQVRLDSTDYLERAALLLAPINPGQHGGPTALRLPQRPTLRLRRFPGDGGALLRTLRRRGDHRRGGDPLRALGYESRRHPRPRLAARRPHRMTEGDPVSWLMIEPGWKVVDAQA